MRPKRTGSASERDEDGIPKVEKQFGDLSEVASSHSNVDLNEATAGNAEKSVSEKVQELLYMEAMRVIEGGGPLEKMTIPQCKAYLRTHKLLLSGNKPVLLDRIREHLKIKDSGGYDLYPKSSFVVDCTGDVCCGDIILFQQNVFDSYDLATRKSLKPPLGRRVVAGRVVKESYGVSKQQHTFTIEVLWSTGVKPLAPLTTLLVKGRNLYRFKTYRQIWQNEEERKQTLEEKHKRGEVARTIRAIVRGKKSSSQSKHERRKRRLSDKASVRKEVVEDQDPEVESAPVLPETKRAAGEPAVEIRPVAPTRKRQRNDVCEELSCKRKRTEQTIASYRQRLGAPCYSPTSGWQLPTKEACAGLHGGHQVPSALNPQGDAEALRKSKHHPRKLVHHSPAWNQRLKMVNAQPKKKKSKSQAKLRENPKQLFCQCRNLASVDCVNRCCRSCCREIGNACHRHR